MYDSPVSAFSGGLSTIPKDTTIKVSLCPGGDPPAQCILCDTPLILSAFGIPDPPAFSTITVIPYPQPFAGTSVRDNVQSPSDDLTTQIVLLLSKSWETLPLAL